MISARGLFKTLTAFTAVIGSLFARGASFEVASESDIEKYSAASGGDEVRKIDNGDGTIDFADENGEWLKTRGFYFTMDAAGNITFTGVKGNLSGYMDWSTNSTAKVTEQGIELTLDTGAVVLLAPKAW